jgi:hypothetical protein
MRSRIEIDMYFRDGHRPTQGMTLPIDEQLLWEHARNGSQAARAFLRRAIQDQMIEPLLDLILKDLVDREREEAERKALFGDGPITVASMENAITELVKRRRSE